MRRRPLPGPFRLRQLLLGGFGSSLLLQVVVIAVLSIVDSRRKRRRQGSACAALPPVAIADSEVRLYTEGAELYAAMLQSIAGAEHRILLETYIWHDDQFGHQFKQAIEAASRSGVAVYAIFDGLANLPRSRAFKRFAPAVHVLEYPLLSWPWHPFHLRSYARDHRKLLVVDGSMAFVGGFNIGAEYACEWRDTHACVTGPSVAELEHVFVRFWNEHRRKRLPAIPDLGFRTWERRISVHRNDPPMLMFPIRSVYLEAIDRAQSHIYLTHAYFIPDRVILAGLLAAAARGVDVRVLLPEKSNHVVTDWLARGYYQQCLAGGIRLIRYRYMVHAKTATIDDAWSTVGTANLDRLSMIGNFEVNVEFYDEQLARQMRAVFDEDCTHARELFGDDWRRRPVLERLAEAVLMPLRVLL